MIHLYDRATILSATTLDLDPDLRPVLTARIAALDTSDGDLTDYTEFLVVERADAEADIVLTLGFSPLIDPITGARFGMPDFAPGWDHLADHGEWFEMIVTFGSTFAYVLLIEARTDDLGNLCRAFADP